MRTLSSSTKELGGLPEIIRQLRMAAGIIDLREQQITAVGRFTSDS
jgi:hypothetical protein